jgi:outer membrane receptor for ferrienterochelin and colicins
LLELTRAWLHILIFTGGVCCLGRPAAAQELRGKVFARLGGEGKEALPGAAVFWLGTSKGTTTNENGVFALNAEDIADRRLVVTHLGFANDTLALGDKTYISIVLTPLEVAMDAVEIVSGRGPSAYISALHTAKTEVITQRELTKAACCDLSGCFDTQGTVQAQVTNVLANAKELRILGLSGVYNQTLINGLPLIQGLSYTYGVSGFPGVLVDNIFVAKGANSVLQGFESISGQINVELKKPYNADPLLLNVYLNSFGERHLNAAAAVSPGRSKHWKSLLGLHTAQPARRVDRDGDGFLDLPLLTRYMAYNHWTYRTADSLGLSLEAGARYSRERRVGGQVTFDERRDQGSASVYGLAIAYDQPETFLKTTFRFNSDHALRVQALAWGQRQSSYFGTIRYQAHQLSGYLNAQHEWLWNDRHSLKYGLSFRYQQLREDIAFTGPPFNRRFDGRHDTPMRVLGVFAENAMHWGQDRWVWLLGARLDRHDAFGAFFTPRSLLKYAPSPQHEFRASAGTGWRQVNLFSENAGLLASSRDIVLLNPLRPEQALNWGLSYVWRIDEPWTKGALSVDFYQTRFFNQVFPDFDTDPGFAYLDNFEGVSMSNGLQAELNLLLFQTLEARLVYNHIDVYRLGGFTGEREGERFVLPFNPPHRIVGALSFRPPAGRWYFDLNAHWHDKQRLPNTAANPPEYRQAEYSSSFVLFNAQFTRVLGRYELYLGGENLFDFRQLRPIVGWQDPFGPYFDTSFVWGPTRGRELYLGARWRLPR